MRASTRMSLISTAAGLAASGAGQGAYACLSPWPTATASRQLETSEAPPVDTHGHLSNPESFVVVHHVARQRPDAEEAKEPEQTGARTAGTGSGLIEVPANARAGDPAYASNDEGNEGEWYFEDSGGTVYGPYGTVFADGVELGYSALRGHGAVHRRHHGHQRPGDSPEFGADDLHRSAELEFSRVAQPHLAQQEEGFRQAQLRFHQATVTPGVARQSDGLRHESTPVRGTPRHR